MFCEQCGGSISDVAKFCKHCGHQVLDTRSEGQADKKSVDNKMPIEKKLEPIKAYKVMVSEKVNPDTFQQFMGEKEHFNKVLSELNEEKISTYKRELSGNNITTVKIKPAIIIGYQQNDMFYIFGDKTGLAFAVFYFQKVKAKGWGGGVMVYPDEITSYKLRDLINSIQGRGINTGTKKKNDTLKLESPSNVIKFDNFSIWSLVTGGLSIFFSSLFLFQFIAVFLGILGIVKTTQLKTKGRWMAITGLIIGIIYIIVAFYFQGAADA